MADQTSHVTVPVEAVECANLLVRELTPDQGQAADKAFGLAVSLQSMLSAAPAPEGRTETLARAIYQRPDYPTQTNWADLEPKYQAHWRERAARGLDALATRSDDKPGGAVSLREALDDALKFISDMGIDLHHARVADWYEEGANNAALQMSEDMRLAGNRCADYEPLATREEAPAVTARCCDRTTIGPWCDACKEAPAEAGEDEARLIVMTDAMFANSKRMREMLDSLGVLNTRYLSDGQLAVAFDRLRAQPQAREDAGGTLDPAFVVWLEERDIMPCDEFDWLDIVEALKEWEAGIAQAREDAQPWERVAPAYRFGRTIQPEDVDHLEAGSLLRFYSDDPWFDDSGDMPRVGQIVRFTGKVERERFPTVAPHLEVAALDGRVYPGGGWQCHLFQFVSEPDTHPAPDALRTAARGVVDWCDLVSKCPDDFPSSRADANLRGPVFDDLRAALQAEQKGGA